MNDSGPANANFVKATSTSGFWPARDAELDPFELEDEDDEVEVEAVERAGDRHRIAARLDRQQQVPVRGVALRDEDRRARWPRLELRTPLEARADVLRQEVAVGERIDQLRRLGRVAQTGDLCRECGGRLGDHGTRPGGQARACDRRRQIRQLTLEQRELGQDRRAVTAREEIRHRTIDGVDQLAEQEIDVCNLRIRNALQEGVQSLHVGDQLLDLVECAAGQPRELVQLPEFRLLDDVGQAQDPEQLGPVEDVLEPDRRVHRGGLGSSLDVPRHRTCDAGQPAQRQIGSDEAAGPCRLLAERHAERRLGRIAGEEHLAAVLALEPVVQVGRVVHEVRSGRRSRDLLQRGHVELCRSHHRQEARASRGQLVVRLLRGNLGAEGDRLRREGRVVRGVRLGPCDELAADGHLGQKAITRARPRVFLIGGDHAGRDDRLGVVARRSRPGPRR